MSGKVKLTAAMRTALVALAGDGQLRRARRTGPWWMAEQGKYGSGFEVAATTASALARHGLIAAGYEPVGRIETYDITPAGRATLQQHGDE